MSVFEARGIIRDAIRMDHDLGGNADRILAALYAAGFSVSRLDPHHVGSVERKAGFLPEAARVFGVLPHPLDEIMPVDERQA